MPSVRSLATDLSINPNTIQRAYGELERKGFIYSVKGRGSFVGSIHKLRESARADLVKRLGLLAKEARTLGMKREEFVDAAGGGYDQAAGDSPEAYPAGGGRQSTLGNGDTSSLEGCPAASGRQGTWEAEGTGTLGSASVASASDHSPEAGDNAGRDRDKGGMTI